MKKRRALLIVFLAAAPIFAEEEGVNVRRMAVTINPNPLFLGTMVRGFGFSPGFEYAFTPQFAAKAQLYYFGFDPKAMFSNTDGDFSSTFRISADARWYPMENYIRGLFANGGLQFQYLVGQFTINEYEYEYDKENDRYNEYLASSTRYGNSGSVGFFAGLGYKLIFGKNRFGLVLEPTVDYIFSVFFGNPPPMALGEPFGPSYLLGTQGFRFALHLGVAF